LNGEKTSFTLSVVKPHQPESIIGRRKYPIEDGIDLKPHSIEGLTFIKFKAILLFSKWTDKLPMN